MRVRGFEVCDWCVDEEVKLPSRVTSAAAGYDFFVLRETTIAPSTFGSKPTLVETGIKAYMKQDEVLFLFSRSSLAKQGLQLANCVGVVDADYYGSPGNDGHIMFALWNFSNTPVTLRAGERIGQGIFSKYNLADNDLAAGIRGGGFGSTGK